MSELVDLLGRCGFAVVGDPPSTTLDVLGRAVHATFRGDAARVAVEVRVTGRQTVPVGELDQPALVAPGDTSFAVDGHNLIGRRTLLAPSNRDVYDAVHELGKAVVALSGVHHGASAPAAPPPAGVTPPTTPPPSATATAPPDPPAQAPPAGSSVAPAAGSDAGYWCFVDAPTELRAAPGSAKVVAMLVPGVWYQATRDDDTWAHVTHPSGVEGVVPHTEVNPA